MFNTVFLDMFEKSNITLCMVSSNNYGGEDGGGKVAPRFLRTFWDFSQLPAAMAGARLSHISLSHVLNHPVVRHIYFA